MENMNSIYLRRKQKLVISEGTNNLSDIYISTMLKNIENLGFTFSKELIARVKTLSIDEVTNLYKGLVSNLKELIGVRNYQPMYPNFPTQVMNASEVELYLNAIIHYISNGQLLPDYEKEEKFPLIDQYELKVINLGTEEEFKLMFTNLISSKTSISETDKKDIEWLIEKYKDIIVSTLPKEIPLKENVALLSKLLLQYVDNTENIISKYFKTATDVLRLAASISEGDISLATDTKFRSFKRKERRLILSLLESCNNIEEDMLRYKNRWIRLGEKLHPGEYTKFIKVQEAFDKLRNNKKIETFGGKTVALYNANNYTELLKTLKTRPGEFARKLDFLLRNCPNSNLVLNEFKDITSKVSSSVLLQVLAHFKHRNDEKSEIRSFFPKGNVAKIHVEENNLPSIPENICNNVVKICEFALINIYKQKEFLGNIYLDESLKNYIVPFSQRSASKALRTIVRGSKVPFSSNTKTLRSFIYWKQAEYDRVDIDLSAVMYNEKFEYMEHISYTNLRSAKYNTAHSGDITSAPNGASEFIDVDLESVKKYGGRYIAICINSFTHQPFNEIPECFMGWMEREEPKSGEIYEPKTVQNKIDVSANSQICLPIVIDVIENKIIWMDLALKSNSSWYNNVEGNSKGIPMMCKAIVELKKPTLYELFSLHAKARGIIVDKKDDADIIFDTYEGTVTPFDYEKIISEYL